MDRRGAETKDGSDSRKREAWRRLQGGAVRSGSGKVAAAACDSSGGLSGTAGSLACFAVSAWPARAHAENAALYVRVSGVRPLSVISF